MAKLSDDLITISTMLMTASGRGEVIRLAGELNSTILKAMDLEKTGAIPKQAKALSATIKFTSEELKGMSKTFKKEFIAGGCVAHIIKRPSGKSGVYYEIRYRRNGYNITVSNKDIKIAKQMFIAATSRLESPEVYRQGAVTFGQMTDEWLDYKKDKVHIRTWQTYKMHAEKYFDAKMKNTNIKSIRTAKLSEFMSQFKDRPRMYEEMRILLNSVFKYAVLNAVISHNPVTLLPFKRAERISRRSLTDEEIRAFLENLKDKRFDNVRQAGYCLYFFGVRPCELDDETHIEGNFFVCRNRKRKNGKIEYKKIPVPSVAREYIDFDKPFKSLYKDNTYTSRTIKEALPSGLVPYNLRHTFATTCQKFVRPDIVDIWLGDSSERLVGRVYTHFDDKFMCEQMSKVKFVTI